MKDKIATFREIVQNLILTDDLFLCIGVCGIRARSVNSFPWRLVHHPTHVEFIRLKLDQSDIFYIGNTYLLGA